MQEFRLSLLVGCLILLVSCTPKHWQGKKPKTKEDKFAFDACNCLYSELKDAGFSTDSLIASYDQYFQLKKKEELSEESSYEVRGIYAPEYESRFPAEFRIVKQVWQYIDKHSNEGCFEEIDQKARELEESGEVNSSASRKAFMDKCKLAPFIDK